jgi:uncharacterized membrane protein
LKKHQHNKFTRINAKGTPDREKPASGMPEEKTIILTVLIALLIISALLVNLALQPPKEEKFSVIYYLDSEKQTDNLPKTVILGENSTFSLWVGVENHNDATMDYSVLVKIDNGTAPIGSNQTKATESFSRTLVDEETWEFPATVTINQLGHNRILFELWFLNKNQTMEYSGIEASLSLEAT